MSTGTPSVQGLAGLGPATPRRGLRDHVYESILQLLLDGTVEPGARLSIDTIARQLGVSPTPVREAMVELERTGLVTREALKGYRVAPPLGAEQLQELFEARLMLEVTAARLATPANDVFLDALRQAQSEHRLAGERVIESMAAGERDMDLATDYFAKDTAVHRVVFDHCGNRYLAEMSEGLGAQLHRMRQSVLNGVTDVREAIAEHEAIVHAFERGTAAMQTPEQAMRFHIEQVRSRSLDLERSRP